MRVSRPDVPSRLDLRLAFALLATDVCFVLLNGALLLRWVRDPMFSLTHEGGLAEWFQYAKELGVFVLLGVAAIRRRTLLLGFLSLLFLYFLLDDALAIHERVGAAIASRWALEPFVGELGMAAVVGVTFVGALGFVYRSSEDDSRRVARWLLSLTTLLAVFAAGVDALAEVAPLRGMRSLLGHLDDLGELVVMSAILTFVAGLRPFAPPSDVARERKAQCSAARPC